MMTSASRPFDSADYLTTPEAISEYLKDVLEDFDEAHARLCLSSAIRALDAMQAKGEPATGAPWSLSAKFSFPSCSDERDVRDAICSWMNGILATSEAVTPVVLSMSSDGISDKCAEMLAPFNGRNSVSVHKVKAAYPGERDLTDAEILAAAESDPDNLPATEAQLRKAQRVVSGRCVGSSYNVLSEEEVEAERQKLPRGRA